MSTEGVDVIVIGAGPSGTMAAARLADLGHRVTVIERARFPRFMIGESLLPLSMGHWDKVGLLSALVDRGYAVKNGARFIRKHKVFDLSFGENFTDGWTWTWQVPRADFDKTLADATEKKGVHILYEHEVVSVDLAEPGRVELVARHDEKEVRIKGKFLIDSSGYGGVLVKLLGLKDERAANGRMAMFTHVTETEAFRAGVKDPMQISFEIIDTDLWSWCIPFSNEVTSLGFVGHERHFEGLGDLTDTPSAFNEMLSRQQGFGDRFDRPDHLFAPKVVREYAHSASDLHGANHVLTGNCAGFLDPVFSSGVAFATESGMLAAELAHRQLKGGVVDWEVEYAAHIREGAAVFHSYIEAWYNGDLHTLFFAPDLQQDIKEKIVSVLAGYVWDRTNPFVTQHRRILSALASVVALEAPRKG